MKLNKLAYIAGAAILLASGSSWADTITFQFAGTVVYGSPMAVLPGTQIVGTFGYDTETAAGNKFKGYADYQITGPTPISATVGGHTITTGPLNVAVWNHVRGNVEDMIQISGQPPVLDGTSLPNGTLFIQLASAPRNNRALNSTKLPASLDVNVFDAGPTLNYGTFQIDGGPQGTLLQFTIDHIAVVQRLP